MKDLKQIESESLLAIEKAASFDELEDVRVKILGRKSDLTAILRSLRDLPIEERRTIGAKANALREKLEKAISDRAEFLSIQGEKTLRQIDVTLPGAKFPYGHLHPLVQVQNEIIEIFFSFGYTLAEGPDIETEEFNFDMLNIPKEHPARDMWDTFYVKDKSVVLRTHTSPVQIRYMLKHRPPLRIFAPGRVFRYEQIDPSHLPNFYQCEGLVIDKDITLANLKGTVEEFLRRIFGEDAKVRMRQSYFPFTEPSVEFDVSCTVCKGKVRDGCRVCKDSGWLEIMGAGMVHPQVLRNVGLDPEEWQGFAFGMGVDRICMLRFGIEDIRLLYSSNLRFLEQF